MNLYVLAGFNNYYNRIVKKYDTINEYEGFVSHVIQNVNFIPNDGVNTKHVVGSNVNTYSGAGDYVLVVNEYNQIVSRWFIIEQVRDRAGQYTLTLHRDLVADYYDYVIDSPMFLEKATLTNDNPLILNSENISVNQIFTKQILLKDESQCGWFVGYYTKDAPALTGSVNINSNNSELYKIIPVPIEQWEYVLNPFIGQIENAEIKTRYHYTSGLSLGGVPIGVYKEYRWDIITQVAKDADAAAYGYLERGTSNINTYIQSIKDYGETNILNLIQSTDTFKYAKPEDFEEFYNYNNKLVVDSTGTYYDIKIIQDGYETINISNLSGAVKVMFTDIANNAGLTGTPKSSTFSLYCKAPKYKVEYIRRDEYTTTYNIPQSNKLVTADAPYNIFAIPYGEITVRTNKNEIFTTTAQIAEQTVASIMGYMGDGGEGSYVYDIQLIGYCPVNFLLTDEKEITITDPLQCSYITTGENTKVGVIFNVPSSRFTTNILTNLKVNNYKMDSICDMYRLVAPDQSSYFDIDIAKNAGISYINIDVDLKPYSCYIHANPDFKYLYGQDFNTARGLIFGSNLSLSRALDNFTEYQIQNSQYQNIFDRQIQNMELNNSIARQREKWQIASGTVTGGTSGAFAGAAMSGGNPYAIAAGAVISTGMSLAGGLADLRYSDQLRNEALDYTSDLFGYQLQTIRAQPNTLSKLTALTQNNTVFIAIEYYTCTDEEKRAVANKIAYNGMTVMAIGTINEYKDNTWEYNGIKSKGYIKGQLIRIERIDEIIEDFHLINALASELNKGVYFE